MQSITPPVAITNIFAGLIFVLINCLFIIISLILSAIIIDVQYLYTNINKSENIDIGALEI